ncbi:cancer-associated gene 1 protein isoform X3 [Onychomys torridus]|uniref:cancer-associated gene 1 protein isoform X3 n=1 Tax=Onychomys torridus TaxID=38674 RepID=UPI00167F7BEE|nr:cancer-associated gene 1 protein isoform X3 [Onychomys torridus]
MEDETKNIKRGNESTHILSEDIYSTQDSLIGDVNLGNYSESIQNQPANTRVSSSRQFEPICKFHWIEAFNDEMTFQDLGEDFSYSEKPELQSQEYNDTAGASEKLDAYKGESPMEDSISENKYQLVDEHVRKSPRSLSLNYYRGETQPCVEKPLARSAVVDVALNISQPQSFLCKKNVCGSGEDAFDSENCLDLLDFRTNYETEEPEVSSKEMENSGEISEMSVSHQEEVTEDCVDSLAITSSWSPAGIFKSRSQDKCMIPDRELSFENLEPLEEDMALNEALQRLKQTNKKQEKQIQDLHGRNLHLENRLKELQMKVTKQQVLVDIINKLKENMEALIDDKYNVLLEKNDINKKFQDLQEVSASTKKHLQESKKDKETLQLQVKKIKVHYVRLQEKYMAEIQQRNRSVSQCLEIERTLSQKDEELQRLQQQRGELEMATSSALGLLNREKEIREQEFLAFQEEFQRREKENLKEKRKLKSRVEKLVAEVKSLLFTCESERAKSWKLQQQVDELKQENEELQQQAAKGEAQACTPKFEIIQSREQLEEVMEAVGTQVTEFDSEEAKNAQDAPVLLAVKLDKYHNLNEELDFLITKLGGLLESKEDHCSRLIEENNKYRRHVGSLINKVTSYEEIIKCADQRLEISHSQIAHLEERNRHLEDLIRMPKEKARRSRPRLENHPKSMTLIGHLDGHCKECSISM